MAICTKMMTVCKSGLAPFYVSGKLPWFASGELPRDELDGWKVLRRLFVWKETFSEEDWRAG